MNPRCRHCPVRSGLPCRGQVAPRLCQLIDPGHPDYNPAYAAAIVAAPMPRPVGAEVVRQGPPALLAMAGGAMAAAGRAVVAAMTGAAVVVPAEVYEARLAICRACVNFEPGAGRCRLCGCYTYIKLHSAQEACPDDPPRWGKWEAPNDDGRVA